MTLEICVTSFQDALIAQSAGADRIELCHDLSCGGLTPDTDLFTQIKKSLSIPIHVLIRPRAGDFCYSESEKLGILAETERYRDLGADGIVCGALTSTGDVDLAFLERMLETMAGRRKFTFHRAIDVSRDPVDCMQQLANFGIDCVLSSGGATTVKQGLARLEKMASAANSRTEIMAGGGLRLSDIPSLLKMGIQSYHTSGSKRVIDKKGNKLEETVINHLVRKLKSYS